jgi:hypothetical protein
MGLSADKVARCKGEVERLMKVRDDILDLLKPVEADLKAARWAYAEAACFCKVGDKIQIAGRPETAVIVSAITPCCGDAPFNIRAFKIKKNGEPYIMDHSIYYTSHDRWDDWGVVDDSGTNE